VRPELPTGTVTFLFTDVEGSTSLLRDIGVEAYAVALADHRAVIREECVVNGGVEVDTQGDAFFFAFPTAPGALTAASALTERLEAKGSIRVRVGIHTGTPFVGDEGYVGYDVHRAARIAAVGHGGQVLVSASTASLLDAELTDLGEHRFKDLGAAERVFQLGSGDFPALKSVYRTNFPVPATPFLGRERELREVVELFTAADARLVTLTGPGGVGKTRLALQAVAQAADVFPEGVWWVPLASLRDPGLVLSSVARALGIPEQPGRGLEETLVDVLSAGRATLLLDNLEHLLPAAAESVVTLRDAGGATVVVTSRERLQLSGERVYDVAPLAAPDAIELFCSRTAALGFDSGDPDSIAELCSRLDNLPLALELAAARAGLFAPNEILSRLGDRLDRLKGGRDADPRQQTLRATISWSHDLLDEPERELFAALAVFSGGATIDAVEAVCHADLDVLTSLFDKSLVRRTGERVWMLETIREFASERLSSSPVADEVRDRHADYFLARAESWDRELRGPGQARALDRFASERENFHAAVRRLLKRDASKALRLAAALGVFSFMRGHFRESRELLAAALAGAPAEATEARAYALVEAGLFASDHGDHHLALDMLEEGLACARAVGSTSIEANALSLLSFHREVGKDEQIRVGEEAIAKARASGDRWLLGLVTGNQGSLMADFGESGKATALNEEAYRLCREVGDVSLTVIWLSNLAQSALREQDSAAARSRLNEALELARLIDDARGIALALGNFGWLELLGDHLAPALAYFEEAAAIARRLGLREVLASVIWGLAQVAAAAGHPERAARLGGAAVAYGSPARFDPTDSMPSVRRLDVARASLDERGWQKAWAEGAELDVDAALRLASSVAIAALTSRE
jgi:predicted ATPase